MLQSWATMAETQRRKIGFTIMIPAREVMNLSLNVKTYTRLKTLIICHLRHFQGWEFAQCTPIHNLREWCQLVWTLWCFWMLCPSSANESLEILPLRKASMSSKKFTVVLCESYFASVRSHKLAWKVVSKHIFCLLHLSCFIRCFLPFIPYSPQSHHFVNPCNLSFVSIWAGKSDGVSFKTYSSCMPAPIARSSTQCISNKSSKDAIIISTRTWKLVWQHYWLFSPLPIYFVLAFLDTPNIF